MMGVLKVSMLLGIFFCLAVTDTEAQSACVANAASCTAPDLSGDDQEAICSAWKEYIDCLSPKAEDCADLQEILDAVQKAYSETCSGVQFLLSWPLYMAVLALSLHRLYNTV